jgi:hypothetical protein
MGFTKEMTELSKKYWRMLASSSMMWKKRVFKNKLRQAKTNKMTKKYLVKKEPPLLLLLLLLLLREEISRLGVDDEDVGAMIVS